MRVRAGPCVNCLQEDPRRGNVLLLQSAALPAVYHDLHWETVG